jgi:hypothetical protein
MLPSSTTVDNPPSSQTTAQTWKLTTSATLGASTNVTNSSTISNVLSGALSVSEPSPVKKLPAVWFFVSQIDFDIYTRRSLLIILLRDNLRFQQL